MEKGQPKCIRKKKGTEKRETQLEKCRYNNDVCIGLTMDGDSGLGHFLP